MSLWLIVLCPVWLILVGSLVDWLIEHPSVKPTYHADEAWRQLVADLTCLESTQTQTINPDLQTTADPSRITDKDNS